MRLAQSRFPFVTDMILIYAVHFRHISLSNKKVFNNILKVEVTHGYVLTALSQNDQKSF